MSLAASFTCIVGLLFAVLGCRSQEPSAPATRTPPALGSKLPREEAIQANPEPPPSASPPSEAQAPKPISDTPLYRHYPTLGVHAPRVALGTFPTPITHAQELAAALGISSLHIKRDDASSAIYGGSKVRKLEFYFGRASAAGHVRVLTLGGVGSNQAVATALFGKYLGFEVELLLLPQPPSETTRRNLLLSHSQGAHLHLLPSRERAEKEAARIEAENTNTTTIIPAGASTPLGNLGFVNAAFELDEQVRQGALPSPDKIYIAMGTMGSAVGLSLGLTALGYDTEVIAVRASNVATSTPAKFRALFEDTLAFIRSHAASFPELRFEDARVRIDGSQLGRGYALPTPRGRDALELAARTEGIQLEDTYTAKCLAALASDAPELGEANIVFWNTAAATIDTSHLDESTLPRELRGYVDH